MNSTGSSLRPSDAKWIISCYDQAESYHRAQQLFDQVKTQLKNPRHPLGKAISDDTKPASAYQKTLRHLLMTKKIHDTNQSDINLIKSCYLIMLRKINVVQNSAFPIASRLFLAVNNDIKSFTPQAPERGIHQSSQQSTINLYESKLYGTETFSDLESLAWAFSLFPCTRLETITTIAIALNELLFFLENPAAETPPPNLPATTLIEETDGHFHNKALLYESFEHAKNNFLEGCDIGLQLIESLTEALQAVREDIVLDRFQDICQRKSAEAIYHHRSIRISEKKLIDWFSEETFQGRSFLEKLVKTRYVDWNDIDKSRIISSMRFGGAMFGVFSDEEIEVFSSALKLALKGPLKKPVAPRKTLIQEASHRYTLPTKHATHETSLTPRDAFFYCCNIERYPHFLPRIEAYFNAHLEACGEQLDANKLAAVPTLQPIARLLTAYPENQEAFLSAVFEIDRIDHDFYDQNAVEYTLEHLRKLLLATTPICLVDGAWLQHILGPDNTYDESARILFKIMAEELGEGILQKNHAFMYRQLLLEIGVELPNICDRRFVDHPELANADFLLPSLMLALSLTSRRFYPELLGFTVSVEMFALGPIYRSMIENLNRHNMDSTFFRVHSTIDNFSTGHARMSVDLVSSHVYRAAPLLSADELLRLWRRIWNGFRLFRYLTASNPLLTSSQFPTD